MDKASVRGGPTVAVVGGGIAGLGAALALSRTHPVEVLDAGEEPGGHARTVDVDGAHVDTGFVVYNEADYPRLTRLFADLGVRTRPTTMSFSVECGCGVSWSSRRPWRAGRRLLAEILRFLRTAAPPADGRPLAAYLRDEGYSESFARHYAMPMASALWSAPPGQALEMPASFVLGFFRAHGLLGLRRHRWRTVLGGSRAYVGRLVALTGANVRSATEVARIERLPDGVAVVSADGVERRYAGVVLAVPAPRALGLLADPSEDEERLLGAFATTTNETVLHADERFLPRRRGERSAWNAQIARCGEAAPRPTVTYSVNRLQGLDREREYCVTLNRTAEIAPGSVIAVYRDEHPQTTVESHAAQAGLAALTGSRRTAFAGAWTGWGFHEDGLASGLRAAAALRSSLA